MKQPYLNTGQTLTANQQRGHRPLRTSVLRSFPTLSIEHTRFQPFADQTQHPLVRNPVFQKTDQPWEAIGAVGQIIGAIAVVGTLVYLATQIRQATRATHAASIQAAVALDQQFALAVGTDAEKTQLWWTYLTEPDSLTHQQRMQGTLLLTSILVRLENLYIQRGLGTLSEDQWQSRQPMFRSFARTAGYLSHAKSFGRAMMTREFIDYMNRLASAESDPESLELAASGNEQRG